MCACAGPRWGGSIVPVTILRRRRRQPAEAGGAGGGCAGVAGSGRRWCWLAVRRRLAGRARAAAHARGGAGPAAWTSTAAAASCLRLRAHLLVLVYTIRFGHKLLLARCQACPSHAADGAPPAGLGRAAACLAARAARLTRHAGAHDRQPGRHEGGNHAIFCHPVLVYMENARMTMRPPRAGRRDARGGARPQRGTGVREGAVLPLCTAVSGPYEDST